MITEHSLEKTVGIETNEHIAKYVARQVESAMAKLGYEIDLIGLLTPPAGSDPAKAGVAVTPQFKKLPGENSSPLEEAMENGMGWLSINENLADHFGRSRGSSNVAFIAVDEDLTPEEVILALAEATYDDEEQANHIQKGVHLMELMRRKGDPEPEELMGFTLWRKTLGIEAERVLDKTERFGKGNAAQDKGGIDLWDRGVGKQLKSVVRYASKGPSHFEAKETPHLFYQWTPDGIVVGNTDEANEVNKRAGKTVPEGVTATNIKKSYSGGVTDDFGRTARVVWW